MSEKQRGLYVEFVGNSGVGKTTLRDALARALPHRDLRYPSKRSRRTWLQLATRPNRVSSTMRLIRYFRTERGMTLGGAAAIAGFINATPLVAAPGRAVLIDEGPCGYLLARGGHGPGWDAFTPLLRPDAVDVHDVFVFLEASPQTIASRRAGRAAERDRRGQRPKPSRGRTGKEATTPEDRIRGRNYWFERLAAAGAICLSLDTDDVPPDALLATLLTQLRARIPDCFAVST